MSNQELRTKLVKCSSKTLLSKISTGKMKQREAKVVATILDKRFPK